MNATIRTVIFAGVAILSICLAWLTYSATQPDDVEGYANVGEPFYPSFNDPQEVTALRVVDVDQDTAEVNVFNVDGSKGEWTIPSHHDYPAEATERLAKTATSVVDVERGALITRRVRDHERFGVIDPLDKKAGLRGRGQRITLLKGEKPLVDLIIGEEVEGQENAFYVRRADEDGVYIAEVELDLSTKFSDWIEQDLLKLKADELRELRLNKYTSEVRDTLQGPRLLISEEDKNTLTRQSATEDWELEGIDPETQEVNESDVDDLARRLANLKIAGVRPKPEGLKPDLTFDPAIVQDRNHYEFLLGELTTKGYYPVPAESGNLRVVSKEGELSAAAADGVVWHLHFGNLFTGNIEEIEVGAAKKEEDETGSGSGSSGDSDDDEADENYRYLLVTAEFDQSLLGEPPIKPVEPQKPAASPETNETPETPENKEEPAETTSPAEEAPADDGGEATESASPAPVPDSEPETEAVDEDDSTTAEPETEEHTDQPKPDPQAEYQAAMKQYGTALKKYEQDLEAHNEKISKGRERVDELNDRFGDWYYVISAKEFESLRLARSDLVKPKDQTDEPTEGDPPPPEDPAAAANQAAADAFLAENKSKEGVVTTDSGLQYKVLTEGEGQSPQLTSRVKVKYRGTLLDGTVFDQSGDETVEFGVNEVIPGWTEALQLMKPGGKWRLFIPPDLAYGQRGSGGSIGPNSLLIFDVELVSVE